MWFWLVFDLFCFVACLLLDLMGLVFALLRCVFMVGSDLIGWLSLIVLILVLLVVLVLLKYRVVGWFMVLSCFLWFMLVCLFVCVGWFA